jgi:hypothetical protein
MRGRLWLAVGAKRRFQFCFLESDLTIGQVNTGKASSLGQSKAAPARITEQPIDFAWGEQCHMAE